MSEPNTPEGKAARYVNLWREFGPNTHWIDLEKIFYELILQMSNGDNCTIRYEDLTSVEGAMLYDAEAQLWRIAVRGDIRSGGRKRFTLAHEIGHFVQHRSKNSEFKCSFSDISDYYNSRPEIEANEFASFLLTPPDAFRDFETSSNFTHESIITLADRFGVSREAAAYRVLKLTTKQNWAFLKSRDGYVISSMVSQPAFKSGLFFKKDSEIPRGLSDGSNLLAGACIELGGKCVINGHITSYTGQIMKSVADDYVYHYLELIC